MRVSIEIPDDLATSLALAGQDLSRTALEAIGIEAYRHRRISAYQLRMLLGMKSRWDLDAFLKERQVEFYTAEDFEQDIATIGRD
ncbi:MAG TPA: UPF0175 family protein [Bryobacteraceae bacterium]|jgi:predicted HTH domain antitoxin